MKNTKNENVKIPGEMQAVYDAVCALIGEGRDSASLTVSEITRRAGIGKGTAYEYFDSKEEMIDGAVCSRICSIQEEVLEKLRGQESLDGQLGIIASLFEDDSYDVLFYQLIKGKAALLDDSEKMREAIGSYALKKEQFDLEIAGILEKSMQEEALIGSGMPSMYTDMIIRAVINMLREICYSRKMGGRWAAMDRQQVVGTCVSFLKKLSAC